MSRTAQQEEAIAIAKLSFELAKTEQEELDNIWLLLDEGQDAQALAALQAFRCKYHRKPPHREINSNDRENTSYPIRA